ncbi:hypothetical protein IQ272_27250 [Chroococcidiopsidales cyanobacterium LEGE 13417]|uniref:hypothetical protein n=1 Tax=Chroococcidiopsis sp. CCALA 051 TaxID=869949 RepID=UPI001304E517|nr:hypothetical protein [Chroococcidiopsis sp. CCALA 051]MBE9019762.1 hypothetical protein [Chroococcidiopsidales cyanobacterium LEGE 13417]
MATFTVTNALRFFYELAQLLVISDRRSKGTGNSDLLPTTNYPLPITHYPLPITHYQLPFNN